MLSLDDQAWKRYQLLSGCPVVASAHARARRPCHRSRFRFACSSAQRSSTRAGRSSPTPGFLHPGSATWIGTQLHGFASGTPRAGFCPVVRRAVPERSRRWSGAGRDRDRAARAARVPDAAGRHVGLALNLVLFLTASWHTYPYFLGSDIVFVFAWLPFVLAGAAGQPALDTMLERPRTTSRRTGDGRVIVAHRMSREQALKRGAVLVGGLTLGIAGLATVLRGSYRSTSAVSIDPTGAGTTTKRRSRRRQARRTRPPRPPPPRPGRTSVRRRRPRRDLRRSGEDVHRPRRRRRGHRCALLERDADRTQRRSAPTPGARWNTRAESCSAPATARGSMPRPARCSRGRRRRRWRASR